MEPEEFATKIDRFIAFLKRRGIYKEGCFDATYHGQFMAAWREFCETDLTVSEVIPLIEEGLKDTGYHLDRKSVKLEDMNV